MVFINLISSLFVKITVGHTPDADDAFMFYGMLNNIIPAAGFEVEHVIDDIETLNRGIKNPSLDVTAVSVHACAYIKGYTVLQSGGSFGLNYGPIVIGQKHLDIDDIKKCKIAIPGKMTSAFLLLQLMIDKKLDYIEMDFDKIPHAVKIGQVDAGLAIHETQLSHAQEGVKKILDIGKWWNETTNGLPVPLGINVMKTNLGMDNITRFDRYLQTSIEYGLAHIDDALDYAMKYSRGKPRELIKRFVKMYVNHVTVNMGESGEHSIRKLFEMASKKDLVPKFELSISEQTNRDIGSMR